MEILVCWKNYIFVDTRSCKPYIVHATPLGAGFVDIFIGQIHGESGDQIQ